MMSRTSRDTSGSRTISTKVALVKALIGLKATLPMILTHISCRIRMVTGARKPAATRVCAMLRERSEREPSGSPKEIRFPSMRRITPGSQISVEKYTIEART